jgi:structural maintenance of chromosome 2
MKRQNHQLDFQFTNPTPNFDRTKHVHGLVATLFNINDKKYAQALELTAGGKLFNVVVDTDETSKENHQFFRDSQNQIFIYFVSKHRDC